MRSKVFVQGTFLIATSVFLVALGCLIAFYAYSKWEQKMKFGKYLNQLRLNLKDLLESENSL